MKLSLARAAATAGDLKKAAGPDPGAVSPYQFMPGIGYSGGGGQPVQTDWDQDRAILEGYKGSTWPFACANRIGGAASAVPWRVLQKKGGGRRKAGRGMATSGEWEVQDGHPREELIERPNDEMSRQFLVNVMVLLLALGGNSTLKTVTVRRKGADEPDELWPIGRYRPVPVDPYARPEFRRINGQLKQVVWIKGYRRPDRPTDDLLLPERVIHAMLPDPSNLLWGMSPMRAIAPIIDMDRRQVAWNTDLPKRFNTPQGAFVDANLKTDGQLDEAARVIQNRFQQGRYGAPLVLGANATWLKMGLSPVEMDWDASRDRNMVEICAAFEVLPSLFISDAKYANQGTAVADMKKGAMQRYLSVIEDAFNLKLVPKAERSMTWIHFDTSGDPDIEDTLPARLEAFAKGVQSGIPINRCLIMFDLPTGPIDGGDKPLVLGTLVPLEQLLEVPDAPGVDDGTDDDSAPAESEDPATDPASDPEEGGEPKGAAAGTKVSPQPAS